MYNVSQFTMYNISIVLSKYLVCIYDDIILLKKCDRMLALLSTNTHLQTLYYYQTSDECMESVTTQTAIFDHSITLTHFSEGLQGNIDLQIFVFFRIKSISLRDVGHAAVLHSSCLAVQVYTCVTPILMLFFFLSQIKDI